jgi:hypothetical protein
MRSGFQVLGGSCRDRLFAHFIHEHQIGSLLLELLMKRCKRVSSLAYGDRKNFQAVTGVFLADRYSIGSFNRCKSESQLVVLRPFLQSVNVILSALECVPIHLENFLHKI